MSKEYHDIRWQLVMAIEKEFNDLQESGYMSPENEDMEVAMGKSIASQNITDAVIRILEPDEYILVDNKFYKKSDLHP